jgi:hypothetical protein
MIRLCAVLVTALLGGALVTGCGSSSSSSTTSAAPSATTTAAPASAATTSAAATSTGGAATSVPSGGVPTGAAGQAAVAACKQSLAAAPTLSASIKSQLANLCDKIATNPAEAQAAGRQVCAEIVKATVPAAEQTAALAACQTK